MSLRLKSFHTLMVVFAIALGTNALAQPVFENQTPVGFSPSDSTTKSSFASDKDISILVDLNETANETYPVIGNFQKVEQAQAYFTTAGEAAYMSQAVEIDANGIIHRAWIEQRGIVDFTVATSTPVYGVVYSKSLNGGKTFSDTVSVSGTLRFDMITPSVGLTSAFSTLDIVVNSKGNPRVVYAMDLSADGLTGNNAVPAIGPQVHRTNAKAYNNIFGGIHLTGVTICSVHGVSSRWQALPGLGWRVSSLVSNRCGLPGLPRMAAVARRLRLSELRPRRRLALGRWPLHVSGVFDTQFGDGRYDLRSDADTLDDMVHRLLAVRHR